ncbi:flagellin [Psychrobacillus sp. OK028]|uniref:flagellin N-terminal helical domain-containing protein n=1 Tax=Psychrobacillus sp. OK028 TaxID=1884359 RepID=UPI00087EC3E4|nr:flagellin [Psychrobacillus sp. OK028]SDM43336.1 flagellin [Psychrobacillus sp. OK028]
MRINHNIAALNTHRQLNSATNAQSKSMEKLASGLRINRAGDDAAGLAISEKMRGQIRGLDQASKNAQDGISMIQTAEGALNETHSILQRMRELATQASNETLQPEDRTAIGEEVLALKVEIDRIADNTEFNGKTLLNGSLSTSLNTGTTKIQEGVIVTGAKHTIANVDVTKAAASTTFTLSAGTAADELTMSATVNGVAKTQTVKLLANSQTIDFSEFGVKFDVAGTDTAAGLRTGLVNAANNTITTAAGSSAATFQIGANAGQTMSVSFGDANTAELGTSGSELSVIITDNTNVSTTAKAQTLLTSVNTAINDVSTLRSNLGASQNRLEHTISNLDTSSENLTASESRIRDVDMAKEMMEQTKNSILSQAAQAMLAQANQQPQGVLQLLR